MQVRCGVGTSLFVAVFFGAWLVSRGCGKNQELISSNSRKHFFYFLFLVKMGGKKKWAKGKVREKINNLVVLDAKAHGAIVKEVPKVCIHYFV